MISDSKNKMYHVISCSCFLYLLFTVTFGQDLKELFHGSKIVPDVLAKTPDEVVSIILRTKKAKFLPLQNV